jgi:DNA-binding IclR family transcriptional regulator
LSESEIVSSSQETETLPGSGTFRKLMEVIRSIADTEGGATFPQLERVLKIPKSTLHRLLQILLNEGMIRLDADRYYRLGFSFFELARLSWDRLDIRKEAQSTIYELVRDVGETVHLAILDGVDVVYVDKLEGSHTMRMASMVGARNPAYCTGVGKALLAYLDFDDLAHRFSGYEFRAFTPRTIRSIDELVRQLRVIRARRYALDDEEHETGIKCVAASIFNFRGKAISSLSVTVPTVRFSEDMLATLARKVVKAADEITARCGGVPQTSPQ